MTPSVASTCAPASPRPGAERSRPVTADDVARTRRAQWQMTATLAGLVIACVTAGYALLYPRVASDLRREWQHDDDRGRAAVTEAVGRELAAIREQLGEIKLTARETRAELNGKIDRLAERVK